MPKKILSALLGLLMVCALNEDILSQENNKIIYDQAYFQKFNITNAADAIKRIPGVEDLTQNQRQSFDPTQSSNKRGFGSYGTQILINGERQSSKSTNIIKTLERIRSESIIRIEVIRGSEAGLDVRSEGVVVNIITDNSSSLSSGTWNAALRTLTSGDSIWSGAASWSTKIKNTDLVIGYEKTAFMNSRLYDEVHVAGDSSIYQYRKRETVEFESKNRISFDLNSRLSDKDIIRINTLIWFDGSEAEPQNQFYYLASDTNRESISKLINWDRKESNDGWEFGGDWEHNFANGSSFKLRTVFTDKNEEQSDISNLTLGSNNPYESSREINDRSENERIIRASFNSKLGKGMLEYGFESAFNKLERDFNLVYLDSNGIQTDSGLINTKGKVEEDRYEGFISYNFPLSNSLGAEFAMNYEWSEISQSGDVSLSREFQYWKPRLDFKLDYKTNRQVRLRIERNVGQINFDDFISSYDEFEERVRAGNPDLRPSTAWEIELEHEWRLPKDGGVITLSGFASEIDGPVERVPISGYAGIGNLGTGERTQAKLNGSIRINEILPGGVVRFMGYLQSTEVTDPVTNLKRDLAWFKRWEYLIGIRQDIPGGIYSWGLTFRSYSQVNIYDPYLWGRWAEAPTLGMGFTAKINRNLNANFMVKNVLEDYGVGRKIIYNGFKSLNDIFVTEVFNVKGHTWFKIELEGTF